MSGERVLVTGGSGRLGQAVVLELIENGFEAVAVDRVRPKDQLPGGARFVEMDLGDIGQIAGAMTGCDAVIHLGAIPAPFSNPDEVVFRNNTGATFAVLQAASLLNVRRAAIASSGSIYGTAFSRQRTVPRYTPVDEDHPRLIEDAYGLSKEVDERTAKMFCRRGEMSIAALRFHWIARLEEQLASMSRQRERDALIENSRTLWGYVDLRDAARACRLAIEVARDRPFGFEAMNIAAADTLLETPTEETIREIAPEVEIRRPMPGTTGAFDTSKATRIIGWEPRHSWRDKIDETHATSG